jgi:hypothetical protein
VKRKSKAFRLCGTPPTAVYRRYTFQGWCAVTTADAEGSVLVPPRSQGLETLPEAPSWQDVADEIAVR